MKDDIKLPPLPEGDIYADTCPAIKVHTDQQLQDYAYLAIEPYKKRIAELEAKLEAATVVEAICIDCSRETTRTVDKLLEIEEMKTETKPFDLERALKGEPVVLRDGTKAYIRHYETELDTSEPLVGYMVRGGMVEQLQWTEGGRYYYWDEEASENDIVGMWSEPLVFERWDLLIEGIKYLAKDSNGRWYGYRGKPSKEIDYWFDYSSTKYYSLEALKSSLFPDCDWENSLIERPCVPY